ncbi:MAG: porphobilinogen synthase [Bdellovibrionales bacterium]|nr:porphobilinogen synthase [Bdellovibrionales bacterium]
MTKSTPLLTQRPRRLRRSEATRRLTQETWLRPEDFVYPLFVMEGKNSSEPIGSMPGQFRWTPDLLVRQAREAFDLGVPAVALFPKIDNSLKNSRATESTNREGLLPRTVTLLKENVPGLTVITDVAMDPYSSDGHDGLVENGEILNDPTLEILGQMALVQANAGADFVAPSDMMDGRVGFLRQVLDQAGHTEVGIISYSAKYASCFYGPFREALDSAPRAGDKKTYQMNPANQREAIREIKLDLAEGADLVMVKPALAYLDVIAQAKALSEVPVAAYNVSGEYAMIKAAAEKGWLNEKGAALESLLAIKRAGADVIFTYWALQAAKWLQ